MDKILEDVHFQTNLKKDVKKKYREKFIQFVDIMIKKMIDDNDLFKKIYHHWSLAGSCFDDLKIDKPNEYDINLIMSFSIQNKLSITKASKPGYCKIKIPNCNLLNTIDLTPRAKNIFENLIDENGYLLQNKFHGFMEKVIHNALNTIPRYKRQYILELENGITYLIDKSKSGPAHTLKLIVKDSNNSNLEMNFDIDFVAALAFTKDKAIVNIPKGITMENKWLAIPKPNKKRLRGQNNLEWICSYIQYEKQLLKSHNNAKPLIRIFKKLRDSADLNQLKSFFIKNIFLLEIQRQEKFFFNKSLEFLFFHMLDVIIKHLENKNIPFFWNESFNLIKLVEYKHKMHMIRRLNHIKRKIVRENRENKFDYISKLLLEEKSTSPQRCVPVHNNNVSFVCKTIIIKV